MPVYACLSAALDMTSLNEVLEENERLVVRVAELERQLAAAASDGNVRSKDGAGTAFKPPARVSAPGGKGSSRVRLSKQHHWCAQRGPWVVPPVSGSKAYL